MKIVFDIEVTLAGVRKDFLSEKLLRTSEQVAKNSIEKLVFESGAVTKIVARAEEE